MTQPIHDVPLGGFEGLIGLELLAASADEVRGRIKVEDHHKQLVGLVHGGVYASIAETMASFGTVLGVGEGKLVSGLSNHASFLRPVTEGTIHAVARPRHRGRTTWVWEVDVTDDADRLCSLVRVTIAVRDQAPSASR